MEILIHIYENKSFQDPWAHFEHPHLKKLGNQCLAQCQVLKIPATSDPGLIL